MINIVFFAALKEKLNCEALTLSSVNIQNVEQVMEKILEQHPNWQNAFSQTVLIAVNHNMVDKSHPVSSGDEIAFFPPVTGG